MGLQLGPQCCCLTCADFPACLTDTELNLDIANAGGDGTFNLDCVAPFTSCHFDIQWVFTFSTVNGNYTLDYIGTGIYQIVLADATNATDVRANGRKVMYQAVDFVDAPCGDAGCADQIAQETEDYITKIQVTVVCDDGVMWLAPVFYCTTVRRSRSCSGGAPSAWGAWSVLGTGFGNSPSPCTFAVHFCATSAVTKTAPACIKGRDMITTMTYGELVATGDGTSACGVTTDCTPTSDMSLTGRIEDA